MRQRTFVSLVPALAAFIMGAPIAAQAQGAGATRNAKTPKRMTVSVEYVSAPMPVYLKDSRQVFAGQSHDAQLLALLLKDTAHVADNLVITTVDGVKGRMDIKTDIPTATAANGQRNSLSLDNFVEVTPHSNTDGTITVDLTAQRCEIVPGAIPPALTANTLTTTRTLRDGQTLVLGGTVGPTDVVATMHLIFLKATVVAP